MIMGCTSYQISSGLNDGDVNLVAVGYTIADKLVSDENFSQFIRPSDPLIVASFVNVNNLEESSSFGRIIAEQITSRFAQRGQKVIELKLRQNSIFISESQGEFMLSRDMRELSKTYSASAVVVGTYADGGDRLYVSARIVNPTNNIIISAYDVGIPMDSMAMSIMLTGR
jgi:TolB-like protein